MESKLFLLYLIKLYKLKVNDKKKYYKITFIEFEFKCTSRSANSIGLDVT